MIDKVFVKPILNQLTKWICPFYAVRSDQDTMDIILSTFEHQEKCIEHCVMLYQVFDDLTKDFDTFCRTAFWLFLSNIWFDVHPILLSINNRTWFAWDQFPLTIESIITWKLVFTSIVHSWDQFPLSGYTGSHLGGQTRTFQYLLLRIIINIELSAFASSSLVKTFIRFWSEVVIPVRVPSRGQTELFNLLLRIIINIE